MHEEVQRDASAATWRVALRPVRLPMYLLRPHCAVVARGESGGKDGQNSKPEAAGALSASAADARSRGNAAATRPFIRVAPGVR